MANRIYFETEGQRGILMLKSLCPFKSGNTKIGSHQCFECEHFKGRDLNQNWVDCSFRKDEAKGLTAKEKIFEEINNQISCSFELSETSNKSFNFNDGRIKGLIEAKRIIEKYL